MSRIGVPGRNGRMAVLALAILWAAAGVADRALADSGLPVPRFVSMRSGEVNLRTGPGTDYPVEWVYQRRRMPVEVIAEFETWRKVRDWQGTIGWVHQSMLDGRRTALVTGKERVLRRTPADGAPAVARLAPGVIGELLACEPEWCRVDVKGYTGWLKREEFWGAYEGEAIE